VAAGENEKEALSVSGCITVGKGGDSGRKMRHIYLERQETPDVKFDSMPAQLRYFQRFFHSQVFSP